MVLSLVVVGPVLFFLFLGLAEETVSVPSTRASLYRAQAPMSPSTWLAAPCPDAPLPSAAAGPACLDPRLHPARDVSGAVRPDRPRAPASHRLRSTRPPGALRPTSCS